MRSLIMFITEDRDSHKLNVSIESINNLYIAMGRNLVVEQFLENNLAEWLLFIDTDIIFNPADVYALLEQGDQDHQIVAGLYFNWMEEKLLPTWFNFDGKDWMTVSDIGGEGVRVQPIASCGMGFTLLGRQALMAMKEVNPTDPAPWFGHDIVTSQGKRSYAGEDITFCLRAAKIGIQTWGCPIVVKHNKTHIEDDRSFEIWNAN